MIHAMQVKICCIYLKAHSGLVWTHGNFINKYSDIKVFFCFIWTEDFDVELCAHQIESRFTQIPGSKLIEMFILLVKKMFLKANFKLMVKKSLGKNLFEESSLVRN